ncbi:uncharacterized protein LOC126977444 isoform X2 [Leptidea sinapis]|uniref:uncharacterized protein LOC126977444 isoform X2 n=1 Tax=Leptidea sinapis TaxID=189913 RepID=UPI0021C26B1E|nr:uncharacterized protein LOC126977444 isoform X2 [Leptidea sinapis]
MDNPLTPSKIQRLIHLAEDKSFNNQNRTVRTNNGDQSNDHYRCSHQFDRGFESSSGILDLERLPVFGESGVANMSMRSAAFDPGELTGRSTGTQDGNSLKPMAPTRAFGQYGRHSTASVLDSITNHMDKQTSEINDIMRHSIASNFSFHSKRDLTADEASLVMREAPIPIQPSNQMNFQDSIANNSSMSVGSYFKNRCPDFGVILKNTDSPDKSMTPSITEVSKSNTNNMYSLDNTLDSVPVRQSKPISAKEQLTYTLSVQSNIENVNTLNDNKGMPYKGNEQNSFMQSTMKHANQISSHKIPLSTDVLVRNLQSNFKLNQKPEEVESSIETSFSISKIADFLGKQSIINSSDIMQFNNAMKQAVKKQPLAEVQLNVLDNKQNVYVTHLKDAKKMETASSTGTVDTVISLDKLKMAVEGTVPRVVVSGVPRDVHSDAESIKSRKSIRSKTPSPSRSQSTHTTVKENNSIRSSSSPFYSSREKWVEISAGTVTGFVGSSIAVTLSITTLADNWITAKFEFDSFPHGSIELPRGPLLLSPKKTEKLKLYITSNVEIAAQLPFTVFFKDASIDREVEQKGYINVDIKMPMIQAVSSDGVNNVCFPVVPEGATITKHFVVLSDCPNDLQLELSVVESDSIFLIRNVQEILKSDVSKVLTEKHSSSEEAGNKGKGKANKQLCRLSSGNAIKVTISFSSPKLSEFDITDTMAVFKGVLAVKLIGGNTSLKEVSLVGSVGVAHLEVQSNKYTISNESTTIQVCNTGSVAGIWRVKFEAPTTDTHVPFTVTPARFEVRPEESKHLTASYTGSPDVFKVGTLVLEEETTGARTMIELSAGCDKTKSFPIKTNYNNMSWVRSGKKELSLKNSTNKKIQLRCYIIGEGFSIEGESRGTFMISFVGYECRPLQIMFTPNSCMPYAASLHLVYDKNKDYSRKILLHGCASNESVRWSGLVTYGDTALVRAVCRRPVELTLHNKSSAPAFISTTLRLNLQYRCVSEGAVIRSGRRVLRPRSRHEVLVDVDWARVERRARTTLVSTLASVTVLSGPEYTRQRILRIIRDNSTGKPDTSMLPDHLKVLAEHFDGQDPEMENKLMEFQETKSSLNELIESLQELTAQIDLPQDSSEDNTILISDDTMVEHHTLMN